MSDLRVELENIAAEFVASILAAVKSSSLSELVNGAGGRPSTRTPRAGRSPGPASPKAVQRRSGRKLRSTAGEIQKQKDLAYAFAEVLRKDFSKGDLMKKSGSKVDLGRALSLLVAEGKLRKTGDRRLTRYSFA
jgi:hypothetical protein